MNPDALNGLPDAVHVTSFVADQTVAELLGYTDEATARYIEAIDAGNIEIVTAKGAARVLPFTAGQSRVIQYTQINSAGTTVTGAIVGL